MVKAKETLAKGRLLLKNGGVESFETDSLILFDEYTQRGRIAFMLGEEISEQEGERFLDACRRRLAMPLQYVLGAWEFDGMTLSVGEGVLIPREDTLALVEAAALKLRDKARPRILDLCAGSGAVGLALARRLKDAEVTLVELSERAFPYLEKNISAYGAGKCSAVKANALERPRADVFSHTFDAIVSNPPYIVTSVLETLSKDVRCEPVMALDGGADGLSFYRAICLLWKPLLAAGGLLAFEIGYDQSEAAGELLEAAGIADIESRRDINGIIRAIYGTVI